MSLDKIFNPLIWLVLKFLLGFILFALMIGLIIGLFTYGKPVKKRRNQGLMDDFMDLGMDLSHLLIGYIIGKLKGGSKKGTWLNDQEILAMMRGMSPNEFEEFTAKLFTSLGYQTRVIGGANDGGIDIEMIKDGRQSVVQCKKFITRKVTPHDVRDFFGAMGDRRIDGKGFFVTTNIFTLEAERFAEGKSIELIDGACLVNLVRESGLFGSMQRLQANAENIPQHESCPACGGVLVRRTNHTDGSQFLGCSRYPKCRFTKTI